jgi:hypothetical protein
MCVVATGITLEGIQTMTAAMKALRFGIEIETVGLRREQLAQAIHSAVGGSVSLWTVTDASGRIWRVEEDGSLSSSSCSGEIVSPILTYDDLGTLQEVVRAVSRAGARADYSTGIHIHVDGSQFNVRSLVNLVNFVHKQERLLEHVLQITDRRLGRYCRPINPEFMARLTARKPTTMEELNRAWYGYRNTSPDRRDGSRYHGLNLNSLFYRKTIEFRYFNGSVDADEVKAYVQLVLALAANALGAKAASSKRRAFDPTSAKYDFRVVLLRLGLIGDEFKTTRRCLTKRLGGSAAWKRGRRDRTTAPSSSLGNDDSDAAPAAA